MLLSLNVCKVKEGVSIEKNTHTQKKHEFILKQVQDLALKSRNSICEFSF